MNSSLWEAGATGTNLTWEEEVVTLDRDDPAGSFQKVCESLGSGVWLVVDMTWSGWHQVAQVPGVLYVRADLALAPFVSAVDLALTKVRNATDAALIYQHETHLEQSLWFLIRDSTLRVAVFPGLQTDDCHRLKSMRPSPSAYVIFADSTGMNSILQTAVDKKLVTLNDRWVLVYLDMESASLNRSLIQKRMMLVTLSERTCCSPSSSTNTSQCACPQPFNLQKEAVGQLRVLLQKSIDRSIALGLPSTSPILECTDSSLANLTNVDTHQEILYDQLTKALEDSSLLEMLGSRVKLRLELEMRTVGGRADLALARWNSSLGLRPASFIPQVKRFFRIGTGYSIPFAYPSKEVDAEGQPRCEGYVIDLIDRLAEMMNFDYELVLNADFGVKLKNGTWTGLIGLLATGRVDMIVASLTMTSEREEVIDFVAPYFEQTGFSIVIRKKVKRTSLFKFMTVLRVEVWLSILGALCLTAIMIWFLDKYSPYSARNNKGRYPYPCRDFSLRESFWFAVTSFTPQGGGEAPKSLSARTLVAAYWLFVVLMLATFTANLAAFLTVERMQSPVQSLKHLAKQSRINYTVVKNSDAHEYFKNMKNAEEVLYTKWKELTLNSSSDQSQFRVWDYPIKEQYGQIYYAIEKAGPVNNLTEGLRKVIESEEAEFALIGDYKKLKYYVYQNCNLTMIGEPFAEQPYAIAVQQGSHLNEEVSRRILDLQRERFFEAATDKYWNSTAKGKCDNADDNEGITLESLGGVFIATLFGLLLALLTLGVELWYHKKKSRNQVVTNQQLKIQRILKEDILKKELGLGVSTSKASLLNPKPKISYITVYPRGQLY